MRFFVFVFAAVNSGLVSIAGFNAGQINWYQAATLGFLSGFSEPFFLGLSYAARGLGLSTSSNASARLQPERAETSRLSWTLRAHGLRKKYARLAED